MSIRHVLILAFLAATLLPSSFFGWWSYREGIRQEFAEVEDRHLLLARNIGVALERYHVDLVATIESFSEAMLADASLPHYEPLLARLNIECVLVADAVTGKVLHEYNLGSGTKKTRSHVDPAVLAAGGNADGVRFSPVKQGPNGNNVIVAMHKDNGLLTLARIDTGYFVELGKQISFGQKGHAAIVDHQGNVLAHPLPDWIAARKNIARVSAVSRMMKGETGIQQFYSPALKGDMIAGLTAVAGPGWGVMIPQPVSELYDKVLENNRSIFAAIGLGLLVSLASVLILLRTLVNPMDTIIHGIRANADDKELAPIRFPEESSPVRELKKIVDTYNKMAVEVGEANQKIVALAHTDGVTKLANRARFNERIGGELGRASRDGTSGALAFIDIDDFKGVNDLYGHQTGDEVLRSIAERLVATSLRMVERIGGSAGPIVSRVGGDEFAVIVPGLDDRDAANHFLEDLLEAISNVGDELGLSGGCSASVGCALYPEHGSTQKSLMRHADIAMYQAKKTGKNSAQIYDPAIDALTETEIRADFAAAIAGNHLVVEYQPSICTRRKAVAGVEALTRWNHPQLGRLAPSVWLPAISNTPLMKNLGDWVFRTAVTDQARWRAQGFDLRVSVNVSSDQFSSPDFADNLIELSRKLEADPTRIDLEITEDALFANKGRAERALAQLKAFGFHIAIDDFGKGYSNLSRLAQLPIDFIKIDQSLISGAPINRRISAILDTTMVMARNLDCKIVAEGVESKELAELATAKGANLLQGFFFAASMPSTELVDWIEAAEKDSLKRYRTATRRVAA